jgi:hypothetical protein
MADILAIPSELEVGVFSDNLLSTQLDTQERIASLFNDFNVPDIQHSSIPKGWNTDEILKSSDLPAREDYLTSSDPKMRELAKNAMNQDITKNRALSKGFGLPSMVRYQEGQEKFTTQHWWSEAGKTKFGFNPYQTLAQNEDFYNQNVWNEYSTFGKLWRGVGTFAGRTLSKLVTGLVGMVGDIGAMAWNGLEELVEAAGGPENNFWADVSDNWLARTMEEADEYVKQQILPTYKSINYDEKGFLSKLTDPYFWTNDIADGAGFLLQFAVPAMLFGKAAQLGKAGKLGRFGKVMSAGVGELPTASRLAKGMGSTLEFLTGSRNVGGITAHAFSTTMESVAETKEGFNATVEELISKGYSEHEAQQIAAENAPAQFGMNMAILSISNAFENKWFQKAVGNRINPYRSKIDDAALIVPKKVPKGIWGTAKNQLVFYGSNGAKAALMEGYWEENAQLAAQRVARGEYTRRGDNTSTLGIRESASNFFKQLFKQTVDATRGNDREAADSILAGAVIGVLGGGAFNKFSGSRQKGSFLPEGTRRREIRENAELVAQVKNAQDAFLSMNTMPTDLYNNDGTINEEKAKERVNMLNEKLSKVTSVIQRKLTLDMLTDQTERENLQYLLFGDYVKAHILNGSGEALINRLQNWGNKSKDELAMYGVDEEMAENPLQWASVAQNMLSEYTNIDKIKFNNLTNESAESYFQKERAIKSLIFDYIAQKQAALQTSAKYAKLEAEANPFLAVDTFNSYNTLIARREALRKTIDEAQLDADGKAHYQAELDKTNKQIEMRKAALPEHETGSTSDMAFEVGSDIAGQERRIMQNINEYLGFQFAKEDFQRAAEAFDIIIKEYSDPNEGIKKWNDTVSYWEKASSRIRLSKLKDLGYTEAEVTNMTAEQQIKTIETNTSKPAPVEEVKETSTQPVEETPQSPAELRALTLELVKTIDPDNTTEDNLDLQVDRVLQLLQTNATFRDNMTQEGKDLITKYVQSRVVAVKENLASEPTTNDSQSETEKQPATTEADPVTVMPEKPFEQPKVEATIVVETHPETSDSNLPNYQGELANNPRMALSFSDIVKVNNSYFGYYIKPTAKWEGRTIRELTSNPTDFRELEEIGANSENRVMEILAERYRKEPQVSTTTDMQLRPQAELAKELKELQDKRAEWIRIGKDKYDPDAFAALEKQIADWGKSVKNPINTVAPTLLEEVREAYRLHQQALENDSTFKEEAERESMKIHNNRIDAHVDGSKNAGTVGIITSNPKELVNGALKTTDNNLSRYNFMDNLITGKLNKEDYKMVLSLSEKTGSIFGIVANKAGVPVEFGENGIPTAGGLPILFYLDYDMFMPTNMAKRRADVVKPPFALAPLTTHVNPATGRSSMFNLPEGGKFEEGDERLSFRTPIELHPSFTENDVIATIKDRIKRKTVTASFDFVTQGLLYREGTTNSYSVIPKTAPTYTASELWGKKHMREEKGDIPLEDMIINGVYRRAHRIQFAMLRDLNNKAAGVENVEFHALDIGSLRTHDGKSLFDTLKTADGKNLFQAAIEGNLEASKENLTTLKSLLRPDKFIVFNLGSNILVINLKKFKKFLNSDTITVDQLRSLTTIEDIKNSELNITKTFYDNEDEVEMLPGILASGRNNYSQFINMNVVTSTIPLKKGNTEGYSRLNKRIALTLDENMDDMNKAFNQKGQENKSPDITEVTVEDEFSDVEKKSIMSIQPEEEENLDDDFTKTECR